MMVVLMHSPVPSGQGSGIFLSTLSYLTMPCIGIFFSISGALLLPVSTPPRPSENLDFLLFITVLRAYKAL